MDSGDESSPFTKLLVVLTSAEPPSDEDDESCSATRNDDLDRLAKSVYGDNYKNQGVVCFTYGSSKNPSINNIANNVSGDSEEVELYFIIPSDQPFAGLQLYISAFSILFGPLSRRDFAYKRLTFKFCPLNQYPSLLRNPDEPDRSYNRSRDDIVRLIASICKPGEKDAASFNELVIDSLTLEDETTQDKCSLNLNDRVLQLTFFDLNAKTFAVISDSYIRDIYLKFNDSFLLGLSKDYECKFTVCNSSKWNGDVNLHWLEGSGPSSRLTCTERLSNPAIENDDKIFSFKLQKKDSKASKKDSKASEASKKDPKSSKAPQKSCCGDYACC